jgi:hypothetical protein
MVSARDLPLRRALLERGSDGASPDPAVVEHKWGLFLELIRWVEGGSCRHDAILRYFGDEAETLAGCGRCDVCLALGQESADVDPETATLVVRKALSGAARVHNRFGLQLAVKLVRGDDDPRLERAGLTRVQTWGNLREYPEAWLVALLRRCVTAGWVSFTGGDRPVVVLTEDGRAVMKGERPAKLLLPPLGRPRTGTPAETRRPASPGPARRAAAPAPASDEMDAAAVALFEALRRHRLAVARAEGIAPFIVASDRTLRDVAALRPRDLDELQRAHGIGRHKAERYGAGFLEVVAAQAPRGDAGMSGAAPRPAAVALEGIAKKFGAFVALRDVTLAIEPGELVCFLGPSGCGKTTLLRIIAGLEQQNAGLVAWRAATCPGCRPLSGTTASSSSRTRCSRTSPSRATSPTGSSGAARRARRSTAASTSSSRWWGSGSTSTSIPPSSRAASSSAWRWPARSRRSPPCSCSTSRCPRSTRGCASRCASRSAGCSGGSASPRSW